MTVKLAVAGVDAKAVFDAFINNAGVPAIEAQECGTPVIVSDFSAQRELIAPDAGFFVAGQPYWDEAQKADFSIPSIEESHKCLTYAYDTRAKLPSLSGPVRDFAEGYDADRVFAEHWVPVLDELERVGAEPVTAVRNLAAS